MRNDGAETDREAGRPVDQEVIQAGENSGANGDKLESSGVQRCS